MGVTTSNKTLSTASINCGGTFNITLSLAAEPDILSNPTDIVLVLDRSRSMAGSPLANLKSGAKRFIQIIDESTDGAHDGHIGNGSHIGIVSFASTATQDTQLITSVADLNAAVDALTTQQNTNHEDAFKKAVQLLDGSTANEKVIVMFTDGMTTAGGDPDPVAAAARAQGIIIYCIGLSGNGGLDEQALKDWPSDPDSAYVAITPDDEELDKLFEDLAHNITKPGARDIVITDTVSPCFRIKSMTAPTKGTADLLTSNSIQWKIDKLGVHSSEGAELKFTVEHIGPCSGSVEVNTMTKYEDGDGNHVEFPSPYIYVDCGTDLFPEECPEPVEVEISGCEDAVEYEAGELGMESMGRILQLTVTLKNVCPHRRVALAAIVTELDQYDNEYKRGLKTMTIPEHNSASCRDVTIRCIKFVLPEDLDVSGTTNGICNKRRFRARFIAHYIDNDFDCCDVTL